jgi:hypothetical protein
MMTVEVRMTPGIRHNMDGNRTLEFGMGASYTRWVAVLVLVALWHLASLPSRGLAAEIRVEVDRADGTYRLGEEATFRVSVDREVGQECVVCLSNDGYKVIHEGPVALVDGKATVRGTLREPGVLRCRVNSADGKRWGIAAAAFEPLRIQPSMPKPDDFDRFWNLQKAKLAEVPRDVRLERDPALDPAAEKEGAFAFWKISLGNIDGTRVRGYFARPSGDGPFPAILVPNLLLSGPPQEASRAGTPPRAARRR